MSSTHVLIAASILAAAIAYAGNQLRPEMIAYTGHHNDLNGVFQLKDGSVRYCEYNGIISCSAWQ